ncbi:MAG: potassium channel family protein [Phycisphaerales bacterium]
MPIFTVQSDRVASAVFVVTRRRLINAILLLAACVLVFSAGFTVIGMNERPGVPLAEQFAEGLWFTLNLVSTVGSLPELSVAQQIWAGITIVIGLGAVLHWFALLQALFHTDMAQLFERRKMQRRLQAMSNHIVVCGFGRVGTAVAKELSKHGVPLLVLDVNPTAISRADELGYTAIEGDCTDEQTLAAASLKQARGLIATLDRDAANVFVILMAREIQPRLRIVTRAERPESHSTLHRAGANRVIVPGELAAQQLSHLMLKPIVSEFIAAATGEGAFDFAELEVKDHPRFQGRTLRELDLPGRAEAIIISIVGEGGKQRFNPGADERLEAGDTLILVCREGGLERIAQLET